MNKDFNCEIWPSFRVHTESSSKYRKRNRKMALTYVDMSSVIEIQVNSLSWRLSLARSCQRSFVWRHDDNHHYTTFCWWQKKKDSKKRETKCYYFTVHWGCESHHILFIHVLYLGISGTFNKSRRRTWTNEQQSSIYRTFGQQWRSFEFIFKPINASACRFSTSILSSPIPSSVNTPESASAATTGKHSIIIITLQPSTIHRCEVCHSQDFNSYLFNSIWLVCAQMQNGMHKNEIV